ncbi:MAG TPA: protein translocase subunit SecD [Opitutaceae bacterium]|nr:protein translocase subunit SecD [Opitutaceae bacterium]
MLKRNLWKLLASLVIAGWAVYEILPLRDIPFPVYAREHATAKQAEFGKLLDEAALRAEHSKPPSVYVALKAIAKERKIDLTQYFPDIGIESTLKNVDKRNDILLGELYRRSESNLRLGLDLAGGVAVTLEADPKAMAQGQDASRSADKLSKAIEIISNRVNAVGVAEPLIRPIGDNRIEIEMPGVNTRDNPDLVETVRKPARLEFRLVHPTLTPEMNGGEVPPGYELMTLTESRQDGEDATEELYIKRIPEMTGDAIANAGVEQDQYGKMEVAIKFTSAGAKQFADVTRTIAQEGQQSGHLCRMAIVLDGVVCSAPTVHEEIDGGNAVITGNFTDREAFALADDLNNPLDLPLVVKQQVEVGPSLAQDAISSGVRAAVIGSALVAAFMITYYTIGGIVAVVTLAINLLFILGTMASLHATITLPGLAGIVLTVGMAVDANILIFERMREELKEGKSLKTALVAGYDKAFFTIVDAHVTQLAICAIMIWLGTGPIKGFGVTLAIGVFSTMFSVLVTSHMVMEWLIEKDIVKKVPMLHFLHTENFDFVKWFKPSFVFSWTIIILGLCVVVYKGPRIFGIDFAGGEQINLSYSHRLEASDIRKVAQANHLGEVEPTYTQPLGGGKETLSIETAVDKSEQLLADLQKAYPQAGLEKIGEDQIGAAIGHEIEMNALKSVLGSMVIILLYVSIRFEFGFAVGAVVASVHDILMTIGVFVLFGHQFSAPMVAAILSIAGYSINDTIVVFDRIREELKLNPQMKLKDVINLGINRVFSRSIMTSFTAFLAALALYVFGTGVINDLSFTFIVGIITGTFSSIFIASPIFFWWHKGDRKHVEAHADMTPKYEWTGSSKASR